MNRLAGGICLLIVVLLCACGGNSPERSALLDSPSPGNPAEIDSALPAPAALQTDAQRDLSIAGPGWYNFNLQYRNFGGAEQGVTNDMPAIDISGSGASGFSVFGVHGFDGDSYPTSLRADVSDVTGSYYLLHTNYVDGRWMTAGPFT